MMFCKKQIRGLLPVMIGEGELLYIHRLTQTRKKELEALFERTLANNLEKVRSVMRSALEALIKAHDEIVPNSKIAVGEGCTYCPLHDLEFECNFDTYFEIIKEYITLCMSYGFWGAVIGTNFEPYVSIWNMSDDKYAELNKIIFEG